MELYLASGTTLREIRAVHIMDRVCGHSAIVFTEQRNRE